MNWNRIRKAARVVAVVAGDAQAIKRGRVAERVTNRVAGRLVARGMSRLWR